MPNLGDVGVVGGGLAAVVGVVGVWLALVATDGGVVGLAGHHRVNHWVRR